MVNITFKTITQQSFTLDLDPSSTILEAKTKIAEGRNDEYAVELQKLIYNGKILEDSDTIENVKIDENKFVVVMLARKKVATPAPSQTPAAAAPAAPAPTPVAAPAPAPVVAPTPAPAPAAPAQDAQLTPEREALVTQVISMGYPRNEVLAALSMANWQADRAVELLLGGDLMMEEVGEAAEADESEDYGGDGLSQLLQLPQLQEIREAVRANPQVMLPQIMQEIAQTNPEFMAVIQQNQEEFLRYMNAPVGADGGAAAAGGGGAGGGGGGARPDGSNVIRLTQSESQAIARIKDMGFQVPEHVILEAYIACDKNEEMAIDYILQRMAEDDV